MATYDAAVLWCALQATLIAALGAVATWLLMRRAPGSAAIAAAGAALTVLGMTLLAPVPLPAFSLSGGDNVESVARSRVASGPEVEVQDGESSVARVDLAAILEMVRRTVGGERVPPEAARAMEVSWASVVLGIGAVVGAMRLGASWRYVARLRASAGPVVDPRLAKLFATLAKQLGVRRATMLAETPLLTSPAIVGWRRPLVLLPLGWDAWSDDELRAALAHELAHAARGDFGWRALASVVQAVHAINPLVHMLVRRLALAQELAADRLAATVMEESGAYLRAISELALRLDDNRRRDPNTLRQRRLRAEPLVLPTFSSFLMRRIAMLRSKDGSACGGRAPVAGVVAALAISIVGAATMALRGEAADAPSPATMPSGSSAMFQREAVDPALIGRSGQGLIVLRVGELMERPAFAEAAAFGVMFLREQWPSMLNGQSAPEFDLSALEYVAGTPSLTFRPKTGDGGDKNGLFKVGCEELVIRFNRDVAWQAWIEKYLPGSEKVTEDNFVFIKLPTLPFLGEARMMVAARDSRTLLILGDLDKLRALVTSGDPKSPDVASTWAKVEGGLATVLVNNLELNYGGVVGAEAVDLGKTPEEVAALKATQVMSQALCDSLKEVGGGFDLDRATNQAAFRLRLTCKDQASAAALRMAIVAFLPIAKANVSGALETPSETPDGVPTAPHIDDAYRTLLEEQQRYWMELFDACQITTEIGADGSAQLCITASAPFVSHLVAATEMADATAGAADDASKR